MSRLVHNPAFRTVPGRRAVTIVLALWLAGIASPVHAGPNDNIKVALHYTVTCDKCMVNVCGNASYNPNYSEIPCSSFNTLLDDSAPAPYVAYVVVVGADSAAGVSSLQFGIWYDNPAFVYDPSLWTGCGDMEFPHASEGGAPWPGSGSGNRVVWDPASNCRRTVVGEDGARAVVGAMFIDTYYGEYQGSFAVTPDSTLAEPAFLVVDCAQQETGITAPGGVISTAPGGGYNPCLATTGVSATTTTWGSLKTRFGQ